MTLIQKLKIAQTAYLAARDQHAGSFDEARKAGIEAGLNAIRSMVSVKNGSR
jgi:hypothetical protein